MPDDRHDDAIEIRPAERLELAIATRAGASVGGWLKAAERLSHGQVGTLAFEDGRVDEVVA